MFRRAIACTVFLTLVANFPAFAYQEAAQIQKLNIEIVEGEGAVNNIRQRMAREPMVQVTDENRKPVAGAAVIFLLPNQGAGGAFANGAKSFSTITDTNGNAVARGMQANRLSGNYQVNVTASHQGQKASTSINMVNAAVAGTVAGISLVKLLLILGAVGGAAAAGAVVATNGGNNNGGSAPGARPPTTVSPGTPTVGVPK